MTILRDSSVIWSLFHVLVMFVMLFESRYPRKKTRILTVCFMGPLILFDTWFFLRFGPTAAGQALDAMLEKGELQTARDYIASAEEALAETKVKRWCLNPVLDAVFASYFRQAEREHIRIEADMDIPEDLHVDAAELSTVFANALENAIHAVKNCRKISGPSTASASAIPS